MTEFTSTNEQTAQLLTDWAQFRASFSNEAPPKETPRTWGFEIETPEADTLYNAMSRSQLETVIFCEDASIEGAGSDECNCECRWCLYHDCNCDDCEIQGSDDPEHGCGSDACYQEGSEYQEVKTLDGGVKTTHPYALEYLIEAGLESVEITEQCGLHLNVGSSDLTAQQVAKVLTAYRLGGWLFDTISGRVGNRYASKTDEGHEELTRKGESTGKYYAVNTQHHFGNLTYSPQRARLEFRQHKGENDASQIRAWAWLLIELVEFAKSDRPLYWLGKAKTLDEFRKALR